MLVRIRWPWKPQIDWTYNCHTKFLPDKFYETPLSLVAFSSILKRIINVALSPPPTPPRAE